MRAAPYSVPEFNMFCGYFLDVVSVVVLSFVLAAYMGFTDELISSYSWMVDLGLSLFTKALL